MSDSENPSTPKTSSVPLKKETVRITLRARPGAGVTQPREATSPVSPPSGGAPSMTAGSIMPPTARRATAPIQLPSAPLPPPAPKASTAPVSLPPAAPPSSVSRPPGPPPPAPRAGAPVTAPRPAAPPGAKTETGAMTAPLSKAPSGPRAAAPGAGTGPMAGGATGALPKATVKLQQTQPMARSPMAAPPSAPVKRAAAAESQQFYEDEKDPEAGLVGMSILCLVAAIALLVVQMLGSDKVMSARSGEVSALLVPSDETVSWDTYNAATQQWTNKFKDVLPVIPE